MDRLPGRRGLPNPSPNPKPNPNANANPNPNPKQARPALPRRGGAARACVARAVLTARAPTALPLTLTLSITLTLTLTLTLILTLTLTLTPTPTRCGDGVLDLDEECDDASACCDQRCRLAPTASCSGECCADDCTPQATGGGGQP